ncbi:MFS transporter [Paraferrimonas sp. SM1919]|uniref:MFS transporter n=1 Tax=Paraferrimonas sp. SM1919 TaxID=2662263 RepID=UPI0013D7B284|nr:MFS transporter [Paraferrimonas sp. SM1919]
MLKKLGIEGWFAAHFAYGIIQMIFIPILVPVFVLAQTKDAAVVGIVMGIIGFSGLSAPILGGLADKFKAHRWVQLIGVASYALAAVIFSMSGTTVALHILGAIFLGVGSASLLMMNPAFVVAGGYSQDEEALKLTRLNQIAIVGALVGGFLLSWLSTSADDGGLGLSHQQQFYVMALIAIASLLITALTNKEAAERVASGGADEQSEAEEDEGGNIGELLMSRFGLFLLAVFFITIGQGVITGQFPNYMGDVFGIDVALSSSALSVSAAVSLIVLVLAGNWMAKLGPAPVFVGALIASVASMVALVLVAMGGPAILAYVPLGLYVIYLQGIAVCDMSQPSVADKNSSVGAGLTQGLLMFSIAIAYAVGNVVGGFSAKEFGFESLAVVVAIVSGLSALIAFISLIGKKQSS